MGTQAFPVFFAAAAILAGSTMVVGCGGRAASKPVEYPPLTTLEDEAPMDGYLAGVGSSMTVRPGSRTGLDGPAPSLTVRVPEQGATYPAGEATLDVSVEGWPLAPSPGKHVHVIVDNAPYIAIRDFTQPLDLDALVEEKLGYPLAEGTHTVRLFPSRYQHESVKAPGAFVMRTFHYGVLAEQASGLATPDSSQPMLTFSRPKGCYAPGTSVLLDFYLSNVALSEDGYRVRYHIGSDRGENLQGEITRWVPHWIEGMQEATYEVTLQLVDTNGTLTPGPFNHTTRSIQVSQHCP